MPVHREIYKSIKDIPREEYLAGGTGLCGGCGGLLALRLFHKALGPKVVFVNVVSIVGEQFVPGDGKPDRVPDRAQTEVLVEACSKAEELGVPCETELLIGYPPVQIAALAEDLDVDLVVVGSRHLTGVKRFLLGSTSRALISDSTRPLLIVPEPAPTHAMV